MASSVGVAQLAFCWGGGKQGSWALLLACTEHLPSRAPRLSQFTGGILPAGAFLRRATQTGGWLLSPGQRLQLILASPLSSQSPGSIWGHWGRGRTQHPLQQWLCPWVPHILKNTKKKVWSETLSQDKLECTQFSLFLLRGIKHKETEEEDRQRLGLE